jgi:hypothetical protein
MGGGGWRGVRECGNSDTVWVQPRTSRRASWSNDVSKLSNS